LIAINGDVNRFAKPKFNRGRKKTPAWGKFNPDQFHTLWQRLPRFHVR